MTGSRHPLGLAWPRIGVLFLAIPLLGTIARSRDAPEKRVVPKTRESAPTGPRPEEQILQALRANPVTAPFRFTVVRVRGQYALSGRVASRAVHDYAIQTMIGLGYSIRDDLIIDTGLGNLLVAPFPIPGPVTRGYFSAPMFTRVDQAITGFGSNVPPIGTPEVIPGAGQGGKPLSEGSVELTIDIRGVAFLRGTVPTQEDRDALIQKVAAVPGISQVVDQLSLAGEVVSSGDAPPPAPRPFEPVEPADAPPVPPPPAPGIDLTDPLVTKVEEAIGRRPALNGLKIQVRVNGGVVTLSGNVPTVYEAMLVYRAAQQTPGVQEVEDRLTFAMPEEGRASPLALKGRPEDIEPYLLAHVRRQLGDAAHVDQVDARGDTLEVLGTVGRADDVPRIEATLRSIPLLRGFRLQPKFLQD